MMSQALRRLFRPVPQLAHHVASPAPPCCHHLCRKTFCTQSGVHQKYTEEAASSGFLPTKLSCSTPSVSSSLSPETLKTLSDDDKELFKSLESAVEALGEEAVDGHPLVEARDKVATAFRDKAALLKRDWTDEMFQQGEDINETRVAELERLLATGITATGTGLEDGRNLGSALDLVGVYMKNYKLDKAEAVLQRCGQYIGARGGVWMVKFLNHLSTVRMKQGRHLEALEMLYELELYSPYSAEEAPEFYETVNRNLAWVFKSLGRVDEAATYFERMSVCSKKHKGKLDWFDCWDIGKLMAMCSY